PTPITAYMACVIKAAAVTVAMRVFWILFGDYTELWAGAVWLVAVLTMFIANVIALRQRSLKRMLAYSSIAHAGYLAMALLNVDSGGPAILFYLVVYTLMTMGAFGIVLLVSNRFPDSKSADDITRLNGFAYKNPVLAFMMTIFMLSLAGIPPAMGGMLGKFYIFNAAIEADYVGLAIIGVLCAAIACYYYLRVIVAMYFIEPDNDQPALVVDLGVGGMLALCALAVIGFGLFPSVLYNQASFIMGAF
ncbi:MAG: hypothetical protein KDD62_16310, partial [Bdellovibrionales bacterium]|nr:hypothetical protein [Bdellovibrionales bacterium]